jgi:hypothetical protein
MAVVVLPTPPFWFASASTRGRLGKHVHYHHTFLVTLTGLKCLKKGASGSKDQQHFSFLPDRTVQESDTSSSLAPKILTFVENSVCPLRCKRLRKDQIADFKEAKRTRRNGIHRAMLSILPQPIRSGPHGQFPFDPVSLKAVRRNAALR